MVSAFAQTTVAVAVPSFTAEVLQNFDAWDRNHDGVLSPQEIDALVSDTHVIGEAAAAAATLKMMIRGGKFLIPPLTRDYFSSYSTYASSRMNMPLTAAAATPGPGDFNATSAGDLAPVSGAAMSPAPSTAFPGYSAAYRAAVRRIKSTEGDVFVGDLPRLDSVKQGHIGDCFFLAVVGGFLDRDPSAVRKMISVKPDGSCDVLFPSGKAAHVAPITDGEVALSSGSTGTGRWVAVLEAAYGSLRVGKHAEPASPDDVIIDTDNIARGGSIRLAMRALTGHQIGRIGLRKPKVMPMPEESEVLPKLPAIRDAVASAVKDHRLIGAGTTDADRPAGITPRHAYTIIGFDAAADTITLWNPHGQTYAPKGEPGLRYGYPTKAGVFTVPVKEFARIFSGLDWETDKPSLTGPVASAAVADPAVTTPAAPFVAPQLPATP